MATLSATPDREPVHHHWRCPRSAGLEETITTDPTGAAAVTLVCRACGGTDRHPGGGAA